MASSKLLKEAIADAKAVRETALANAKLQLEEAFTPRLKSILSQKLRAEAEDMEAILNSNNWNGSSEYDCIDSKLINDSWSITRDSACMDTNSASDWIFTPAITPGESNRNWMTPESQLINNLTGM